MSNKGAGDPPADAAEAILAAAEVFADRIQLARGYHRHLAGTGVEWGLIGPREVPILWERHLVNCALPARLVAAGSTVLDIGSGAGLPGLVWAIARPDLRITLVEPLLRRASWLSDVVEDLGLDVDVVRARAEEVPGLRPDLVPADVVTARAVAPLGKLAGWTAPLIGDSGEILALKGANAAAEVERDRRALRRLRLRAEVVECADPRVEQPTRVIRLRRRG